MQSLIELPSFSVVELSGRDARAFLQAQSMNDVDALADGQWQWNGLLNPKGRVLFLFQLLRLDGETFWLVQPVSRGAALASHLSGFRFRSKVTFTVLEGLHACASRLDTDATDGPWTHRETAEGRIVDLAPTRAGALLLTNAIRTDASGDDGAWTAQDLRAGIPRIQERLAGAYTPQMLGLERISAFSVRKGCYPGQEIVARTHYLGAAKRRAQLLRGACAFQPGDALVDPDGHALGDVVDAASHGDENLALCVLRQYLPPGESIATRDGRVFAAGES
ncbi:MAG TPA: folate-binding protein [Xanthomonadaceae bacterium]|nr:folate-binding protein [Xanthomonadaceae bacterium]